MCWSYRPVSRMEISMRKMKWTALVVSGGLLLQLGSCATDFGYYVLQALASQLATSAITAAASSGA